MNQQGYPLKAGTEITRPLILVLHGLFLDEMKRYTYTPIFCITPGSQISTGEILLFIMALEAGQIGHVVPDVHEPVR